MLVPRLQREVRDPADLVALIGERLAAMRGRDPDFRTDRAPCSFDAGDRILTYYDLHVHPARWWLASFGMTAAAAIVALFTWGIGLAIAAGLALACWVRLIATVRRSHRAQRVWHREAEPMLGWLVMANNELFEPGESARPGVLLVTGDVAVQRDPSQLATFSARLWEWLRGPAEKVPEAAREVIAWLKAGEEAADLNRIAVPARLCGMQDLTLVSLGFAREDLPAGVIDRSLWPVWGRRDRSETMELVPLTVWRDWEAALRNVGDDDAEGEGEGEEQAERAAAAAAAADADPGSDVDADVDAETEPAAVLVDPRTTVRAVDALLAHLGRDRDQALVVPPSPRLARLCLALATFATRFLLWIAVPVTAIVALGLPTALRLLWDLRIPGLGLLSVAFVVSMVVAWWRAAVNRGRADEDAQEEIAIPLEEHPQLERLLGALATAVGTDAPERVVTGWDAGFAVREEKQGRRRRKVLVFDVGGIVDLSLVELASILAHEMAHFRHGHCAQTERALTRARFPLALEVRLRERDWHWINPVYWACRLCNPVLRRAMARVSRQFERQADAVAIQVVGAAAFETSMRTVFQNRALLDFRVQEVAGRVLESGAAKAAAGRAAPDLIALMANLRPDAATAARESELAARLLEEEGGPFATHPSGVERIAAARALGTRGLAADPGAAGRTVLALASLPALFGVALPAYRQAVSGAILGWNTRWRRQTPALRGVVLSDDDLRLGDPRVEFRRYRGELIAAGVILFGLSTLAFIGLAFFAAATEADPAAPRSLGIAAAILAGGTLQVLYARRWGFTGDREGFTVRTLFATRRHPWEAVDSLEMGDLRDHRIHVRDAGGIRTVKVTGPEAACDQLLDLAIEHVPGLRVVAWGTGMARAAAPRRLGNGDEAAVPEEVRTTLTGIRIRGPGAHDLYFRNRHPDIETIRTAIETRLLPWMEESRRHASRPGEPPAATRQAQG